MTDLVDWLRRKTRASHMECKEPGVIGFVRVPCEKSLEAADRIEALEAEVAELKHDLACQMSIANSEANAAQTARSAALEEAAKVAESDVFILSESRKLGSFGRTRADHAKLIATAIRHLIKGGEA